VSGVDLAPMRLFHLSNTYLALLFLVIAIDAVAFG
jgi:heme O synthase-like polyprenyltransferase